MRQAHLRAFVGLPVAHIMVNAMSSKPTMLAVVNSCAAVTVTLASNQALKKNLDTDRQKAFGL